MTTKDNLSLSAIEGNDPKYFELGGRKYRIYPMTNAVAERADKYVAQRSVELTPTDNVGELVLNLSKNRKVLPKYVSLLMLHSWLKVTLFHWIHWRYIHRKYPLSVLAAIYRECSSLNDVGIFFQFTASLQANSRLIKRMSEANTSVIAQELKSEEGTI